MVKLNCCACHSLISWLHSMLLSSHASCSPLLICFLLPLDRFNLSTPSLGLLGDVSVAILASLSWAAAAGKLQQGQGWAGQGCCHVARPLFTPDLRPAITGLLGCCITLHLTLPSLLTSRGPHSSPYSVLMLPDAVRVRPSLCPYSALSVPHSALMLLPLHLHLLLHTGCTKCG